MPEEKYQSGIIVIEDVPRYDPVRDLMKALRPREFHIEDSAFNDDQYYRNLPFCVTAGFDKNREKFRRHLQRLVSYLWDKFNLPIEGVVEYSVGSSGYFGEILRPTNVPRWLQVETNPQAMGENRRLHPEALVEYGYFMQLDKRDLSMIVGLSAWDKTLDLVGAITQAANGLQDGGYFMHIQDVRPELRVIMHYLDRALSTSPSHMLVDQDREGNATAFGFVVDGQIRTLPDLLKDAMEVAINSHKNLELILSSYLTYRELDWDLSRMAVKQDVHELYFLNVHAMVFGLPPKRMPLYRRSRDATVLVTLARKKQGVSA